VKVCSLYGAGFYYIPGTDICMKVGGDIRWQESFNPGSSISGGPFLGTGGRNTRTDSQDFAQRTRAVATFDTRQQTAYGTLRTYLLMGYSQDSTVAPSTSPAVYMTRGFIQIAGFTFGKATSFFDFVSTAAIAYNAGNALYQMHRYQEAARRFRQAAAGPASLRQRSYFNLGNSLVRAAEGARDRRPLLERGVAAYEAALRLEPADSAAKWNLELALRRLAEEEKSPGSGGRDRRGGAGANDQRNEGYEGDPETAVGAMAGGGFGSAEGESAKELSEVQARQLLEAVEREQLSTHRARPATRANAGQLDW